MALTKVFFDLSGNPIDQVRKFLGLGHEKLETTQILRREFDQKAIYIKFVGPVVLVTREDVTLE